MRTSFCLVIGCVLLVAVFAGTAGPVSALSSTGGGGWSWLYPQPEGNYLWDAAFADAETGWAVGERGVALRTSDGGLTWTPQQLPLPLECRDVDCVDPLHGWILGETPGATDAVLLRTSDGGGHWTSAGRVRASSIDFASAKVGVACDGSGTPSLLSTADGGSTWTRATFPAGFVCSDLEMADATIGYAVGYREAASGSMVLKTQDGGRSWTPVKASSGGIVSLAASDARNVLIAGESTDSLGIYHQELLLTTDGGTTWSSPPPPKSNLAVGDCAQIQAIATGGPDALWVWWNDYDQQQGTSAVRMSSSTDGGQTWSHEESPYVVSARYVGGSCLWALTNTTVARSGDGGETWHSAWDGTPASGSLLALDAVGDSMWAVGDPSTAAHTVDGGVTWEQQQLPGGMQGWRDVDFADAQDGWAVGMGWGGEATTVAHTSDGGATWHGQAPAPGYYSLRSVCAVDALNAFAGGSNCLMKTTDGGATWQALSPNWPTYDLQVNDIDFSTPLNGLVTGSEGYVFRTADGGATWTTERPGTHALNDIWRSPDGKRIWLAGDDSTLLFSGDAGQTWKTRSTGAVAGHWYSITFADSKNGWLGGQIYAGGEETDTLLLHTSDGGVTWRLQCLGGRSTATDLVGRSADTAFAVAGGLFVTTSGGGRRSGDVTPPTLTAHKPAGQWHNHRVSVSFTGTDRSGMRAVYARADAKPCARNSASVAPARDASAEGMHTVRGAGMDMAGNGSGTVSVKVGIDSSLPTTFARNSATTGVGGSVSLTYGVGDYKPGCGKARCTLKIATTTGRVLRSVSLGLKKTNTLYSCVFRASLPAGRYRWYIYARDIAGNPPHVMYYSSLTVGGRGLSQWPALGFPHLVLGDEGSSLETGYQPAG